MIVPASRSLRLHFIWCCRFHYPPGLLLYVLNLIILVRMVTLYNSFYQLNLKGACERVFYFFFLDDCLFLIWLSVCADRLPDCVEEKSARHSWRWCFLVWEIADVFVRWHGDKVGSRIRENSALHAQLSRHCAFIVLTSLRLLTSVTNAFVWILAIV